MLSEYAAMLLLLVLHPFHSHAHADDSPRTSVKQVPCSPEDAQKGNSCAGHAVHYVVEEKVNNGAKASNTYTTKFNRNKHIDKDSVWIERALNRALLTNEHADIVVLDSISLITDAAHHHLGLDTCLCYAAEKDKPVWIIVNTALANEGLQKNKVFHWVVFKLQTGGQPNKTSVLHKDSLPNVSRAKMLNAIGHRLAAFARNYCGVCNKKEQVLPLRGFTPTMLRTPQPTDPAESPLGAAEPSSEFDFPLYRTSTSTRIFSRTQHMG
jgi:hypothetical protein